MRILIKKLTIATCLLLMMGSLRSQSTIEAYRLLYYQRYEGATHLLQSILKADPNNAEAWWLLTRAYLHSGKTNIIRDSLRILPRGNADAPLVLCAYGQVLLQDNKKDSAGLCFNKALDETKQKDPRVMLAIALAQQDAPAGDAGYAIDLLNRAIKRDKRNPELYVALGNAYRKLANGAESYKAYQSALEQDSRYAEAAYRMGKIFLSQANEPMYVKYFNDAVAADSLFGPAWYELYYHYYFKDVNKAMDCLLHYIAASDKSSANDYLLTDLLYASRKYQDAIQHAQLILGQQGQQAEPRLFKLVAYSYKELNDSARALEYMRAYFGRQNDTGFVVKDYETMGDIYDKMQQPDSAASYYVRAAALEKDTVKSIAYDKKLAELYKRLKDYPNQATWLGKYYQHSAQSTNLDLFNWGLANYMAKDYPMADSVFGLYETKYPDQDFGYYWRARSDAAIDTNMTMGMAIPHYLKLIDIAGKDTTSKTNRKHLVESYGYIAAYKANSEKDYAGAIDYFEKLLSLDPGNTDAQRYISILKKNQEKAARQTDKADKGDRSDKLGKNETSKAGR
jgi:tetratricopeptide (TPR) repeat protein